MHSHLELKRDGAARLDRAALSILPDLEMAIVDLPTDKAGVRIYSNQSIATILGDEALVALVGAGFQPVRAVLFDKSAGANWALGWHQDRTIAVAKRVNMPHFGPWSTKAGVQHVEPPFEFIERMRTIRIHLDDVPIDNAPLLVARGSHLLGKIAESSIEDIVNRAEIITCTAARGDMWIYSTPILHASAAAAWPARRRVMQVDYADFELPGELMWKTI